MKVLQVYNQYRSLFGGEETVVRLIDRLVRSHGGDSRLVMRSSRGLDQSLSGKARAFFSGIYNPYGFAEIADVLDSFEPDIVHVHNLNPLFSPSVLVEFRRRGYPVVMTVHNHAHTCPSLDHLSKGVVCEKCVGGREYHCVLQNCQGRFFVSVGYALRSASARVFRLYLDNVTVVIALNGFARSKLIQAGFEPSRIVVLPNPVEIPALISDPAAGEQAVFSGRMCPEKGVPTLLDAARMAPAVRVRLLGDGDRLKEYLESAPENASFAGQLDAAAVEGEYRRSKFLVVPSVWFEGCPLVILEAMASGLPVIASRIGGLPELVDEGRTGLLFEPGNATDLAEKMQTLWTDSALCTELGARGRERAVREFELRGYWERLRDVYAFAIESHKRCGPRA